ncbi:hypothetical protein EUTSA_v10012126mg [Eutrema salsugineum]|uniref:Ubiquitin-like domain-containing protein n=1 Tax=Eutrema salsugineum TaxID=72664 RepID=V4KJG2_EUTSA|nr:hypothetical protein EUTSA_v10012126mg [Eutrema salsugineum]
MKIYIKTLKGKSVNVEVEDSSNAIDLKIHGEPIRELVLRLVPGPGWDAAAMTIYVKTLSGRTITLEAKGSDTIGEVKAKYEEIDGTPVQQQRLIFRGRELQNGRTVAEYDITHESTLHIASRLCGC